MATKEELVRENKALKRDIEYLLRRVSMDHLTEYHERVKRRSSREVNKFKRVNPKGTQ